MSDTDDCVRKLAELAGVSASEDRVFDWPAIESDLGLPLPGDYKLLAESFPDGCFREFVSLWLPDQWPDDRIGSRPRTRPATWKPCGSTGRPARLCFRIRFFRSRAGC